ncbi:PREDICTED: uncharacterized protein LOC107170104 [Diuraphis noxia]|uniref:uncharacterized protein LOC107170104 n=1 Tax=Diuraphis noxia TaxID=143948 RepID=UPI000763659A|nr:PREDICTED: uncharacterized protein LOC107170104 [Diuraphis noxia]
MAPFTRVQVEKCEKCSVYYPAKSEHECLPVVIAVEEPKKFRKILPAVPVEKGALLLSSDDDVGDNKVKDRVKDFNLTSGLISAIKDRPPLFDHKMMMSERSESIKNKLWNEVYAELQGQITIDELKKKWKYLKEKYVREKQKQKKNGISKIGRRSKWLHYNQLLFLDEAITQYHDKRTTNIIDSNVDNPAEDTPQSLTSAKEQKRKEKNDHNYPRPLLNEHKMSRPSLSTELNEDLGDSDIAFGNYLLTLMKDLPIQKRKKLQCQFITSVITAQDLE